MNNGPYCEINDPPPGSDWLHFIIGAILVVIMFFGLLFLWAISEPIREPINDQAPILEQVENAAMPPQIK